MEHEPVFQIGIAALVGALAQAVQHWFPWHTVFGRELHRVVAYVIGTLAYLVPVSVLFAYWDVTGWAVPSYLHLVTVWACVIASGLAVLFVRCIDWVAALIWAAREASQRENETLAVIREMSDAAQR